MKKKNPIFSISLFLLPILSILACNFFGLSSLLSGLIIASLAVILIQLVLSFAASVKNFLFSRLFLGLAVALIVMAETKGINPVLLIIYLSLILFIFIRFITDIAAEIWDIKDFNFKFIFISIISFFPLAFYLNFGSLNIWFIFLAFCLSALSQRRMNNRGLKWLKIKNWLMLASLGLALISTIFQFREIEVLFNLMLIPFIVSALVVLTILFFSYILVASRINKIKEEREMRKIQAREDELEAARERDRQKTLEIRQADEKRRAVFLGKVLSHHFQDFYEDLLVCNLKNKVVWGQLIKGALEMSREIVNRSYRDEELMKIAVFLTGLLKEAQKRKNKEIEYSGEQKLKEEIENIFSLLPDFDFDFDTNKIKAE